MNLLAFFAIDANALSFYSNYSFRDGRYLRTQLSPEIVNEYTINVSVLKACFKLKQSLEATGNKDVYTSVFNAAIDCKNDMFLKHGFKHTLPHNQQWFFTIFNTIIDDNGNADYEAIMQKRTYTHTREYGRQ